MTDPKLVKIGSYVKRSIPRTCGCEYYKIIGYEPVPNIFIAKSFMRCAKEAHALGIIHYIPSAYFENNNYIIINPKDHFLYITI